VSVRLVDERLDSLGNLRGGDLSNHVGDGRRKALGEETEFRRNLRHERVDVGCGLVIVIVHFVSGVETSSSTLGSATQNGKTPT
jgi:hypothetical protein